LTQAVGKAALDLTFALNVLAVVAKMATAARWSLKTAKVFFFGEGDSFFDRKCWQSTKKQEQSSEL